MLASPRACDVRAVAAYIVLPYLIALFCRSRQIYCGFEKMIRVFDTTRPGRDCSNRPTLPNKKSYVSNPSRKSACSPALVWPLLLSRSPPPEEQCYSFTRSGYLYAPSLQCGAKRHHFVPDVQPGRLGALCGGVLLPHHRHLLGRQQPASVSAGRMRRWRHPGTLRSLCHLS